MPVAPLDGRRGRVCGSRDGPDGLTDHITFPPPIVCQGAGTRPSPQVQTGKAQHSSQLRHRPMTGKRYGGAVLGDNPSYS
jgi:hypothetical protein